jgi:hypothetical protein
MIDLPKKSKKPDFLKLQRSHFRTSEEWLNLSDSETYNLRRAA